jgi:octaprenyl-diphosphate synthase
MYAQQPFENESFEHPIESLNQTFKEDMREVNRCILERMQSDIDLIPKLAGYLIASGGKRIRPLLTIASARLFNSQTSRPYGLAAAVEFIHTATLLHDDVVDESTERRGQETANIVFGNQASVLVGDFLFSKAFQLMVEDGSLESLKILSNASAIIAEGEVKQLSMIGDINITLDTYLKIIESKTAALFSAACEVGPVITEQSKETQKALKNYGYNLGMAFQIADDILDYNVNNASMGKNPGDDFREAKLTAPIIFALKDADQNDLNFWSRTLVKKEQNQDDFNNALDILHKHESLSKSKMLAIKYVDQAKDSLSDIEDSDLKFQLLSLVDFVISRKS